MERALLIWVQLSASSFLVWHALWTRVYVFSNVYLNHSHYGDADLGTASEEERLQC